MKWFTIDFNNTPYDITLAEELMYKFSYIYKAFKQPNGLCLYKLKCTSNYGETYYISLPSELAFYIQIPLSIYPLNAVKPPDMKELKLLAGSLNPNCSDEGTV